MGTLLMPVGEAIALVVDLPTRFGVVTTHLQTLLMSAEATPLIGLDEIYEAPDHHWQKLRGEPKSFLMAVRIGSVELQDGFEAGAACDSCPKATAQISQVINVENRNIFKDVYGEDEGKRRYKERMVERLTRHRQIGDDGLTLLYMVPGTMIYICDLAFDMLTWSVAQRCIGSDMSNFHELRYR